MPADTNPAGDIFGGWVVAEMDKAGAICAGQCAKCRVVTVYPYFTLFEREFDRFTNDAIILNQQNAHDLNLLINCSPD